MTGFPQLPPNKVGTTHSNWITWILIICVSAYVRPPQKSISWWPNLKLAALKSLFNTSYFVFTYLSPFEMTLFHVCVHWVSALQYVSFTKVLAYCVLGPSLLTNNTAQQSKCSINIWWMNARLTLIIVTKSQVLPSWNRWVGWGERRKAGLGKQTQVVCLQ